ncbi:MAG: copper-binding protein [Rubrivivax sp.]|jgi:Cu/Ag efflux protein CusF
MKTSMKASLLLAAASALFTHGAGAQTAEPRTAAEVRRIDTAQSKITLRHERIENLDMPAMTMVFQVADPKLLEGLQAGDKVRFAAERRNGAYTVTVIEVVR